MPKKNKIKENQLVKAMNAVSSLQIKAEDLEADANGGIIGGESIDSFLPPIEKSALHKTHKRAIRNKIYKVNEAIAELVFACRDAIGWCDRY